MNNLIMPDNYQWDEPTRSEALLLLCLEDKLDIRYGTGFQACADYLNHCFYLPAQFLTYVQTMQPETEI